MDQTSWTNVPLPEPPITKLRSPDTMRLVQDSNERPTTVRLIRFTRDNPEAVRLMPAMIERIGSFGYIVNTDTPLDVLVETVWQWFAAKSNALGLWGYVEDGRLIGHLLALVDTAYTKPYIGVNQVTLDRSITRSQIRVAMNALTLWAKEVAETLDIQSIQLKVVTPHRKTAWFRRLGFVETRMCLDLTVKRGD